MHPVLPGHEGSPTELHQNKRPVAEFKPLKVNLHSSCGRGLQIFQLDRAFALLNLPPDVRCYWFVYLQLKLGCLVRRFDTRADTKRWLDDNHLQLSAPEPHYPGVLAALEGGAVADRWRASCGHSHCRRRRHAGGSGPCTRCLRPLAQRAGAAAR